MMFRKITGLSFIGLLLGLMAIQGASPHIAQAMQVVTPTATARPEKVTVTVTYEEAVRVRGGPNSVYYPVVGTLPVGAVVEAIGRSQAGEWIKIAYPEANDGSGVGWVYAPLVTLSVGFLPVVPAPPTAVPPVVPTLDPSFLASLPPQATATRLETFTAPPPLVTPDYENPSGTGKGISRGAVVLILAVIGLFGMAITSLGKIRRM